MNKNYRVVMLQPLLLLSCMFLFFVFLYGYHLHDKDIPPCETIYKIEIPQAKYSLVFDDTSFKALEKPSYHDSSFKDEGHAVFSELAFPYGAPVLSVYKSESVLETDNL